MQRRQSKVCRGGRVRNAETAELGLQRWNSKVCRGGRVRYAEAVETGILFLRG
jgi:hypothetical protein